MLNARGKSVHVRAVTREDLHATASRIVELTKHVPGLDGAWINGSVVASDPDPLSDLDLRFFADDAKRVTSEIVEALMAEGAKRDDNADSIHFPMDYPAVLLDDLYVEFTVSTIEGTRKEIDEILQGRGRVDDGQIHSARIAHVLIDNTGRVESLQDYCRQIEYPQAYLEWLVSAGLDVEMKIIRQAVVREDWHQAMTWLARLCLCSCRILFARNDRFFPGHKRLLLKTIPELTYQPDGFVEFWQDTLSGRIDDWNATVETAQQFATELKGDGQQSTAELRR
jgi:hypothetical protein